MHHKRKRPPHQRAGGRLRSWHSASPVRLLSPAELASVQSERDWPWDPVPIAWQEMEEQDREFDRGCYDLVETMTMIDLIDSGVLVVAA